MTNNRGTTVAGGVVAVLGYILSPEFALQTGIDWVKILPAGYVPFVALLGTLIASFGPSLKKK